MKNPQLNNRFQATENGIFIPFPYMPDFAFAMALNDFINAWGFDTSSEEMYLNPRINVLDQLAYYNRHLEVHALRELLRCVAQQNAPRPSVLEGEDHLQPNTPPEQLIECTLDIALGVLRQCLAVRPSLSAHPSILEAPLPPQDSGLYICKQVNAKKQDEIDS